MACVLSAQPNPTLPKPGKPAMKFANVTNWPAGVMPKAPTGFTVSLYASDLDSPRWLYVLRNGDVLIAEATTEELKGVPPEMLAGLKGAKMTGKSANRITLLRDANKDGKPEVREIFLQRLKQPFGMALVKDSLYVANTDSVMKFPYKSGATKIAGAGAKVLDLPAGGYNNHWTRNILANAAGSKLYVTVGSQTNVDEEGLDAKEPRRAAILEINPDGSGMRIFASGLRNPNGLGWAPGTQTLFTAVNERDMLGDDLVPDYLTSVRDGAFYGWPYSYFGQNEDPRQKGKRPDLVTKAVAPDFALGAHTASLGLAFYEGNLFPASYRGGAFVGQHGSWNRSKFSGYKVVFVPFRSGRPSGAAQDFLTGFIKNEEAGEVYGRPVGVAALPDGSLLVADDAAGKIWRVAK